MDTAGVGPGGDSFGEILEFADNGIRWNTTV